MRTDTELLEQCVKQLVGLTGNESTARKAAQRLRSITKSIDEDEVTAEAGVLKAMSDPCRLTILKLLKEGELCVCEITTALDRPQSSTSHHLSILKNTGLIKERKVGKWSHYRLSEGAIIDIMNLAKILTGR
ncbi:MAG: ArsR family transcriptional regulator [Methanothrix sp.]|nr:MAG: ArsR family transcriptional regulator [Methanothrix sp.]